MGVGYRQVVSKQFEPEEELVAGDVVGEGDGGKPEVLFGTGAEFGAGAVVQAVGGPWPEAVAASGPAVAGGEDGAGAVGKLLRSC